MEVLVVWIQAGIYCNSNTELLKGGGTTEAKTKRSTRFSGKYINSFLTHPTLSHSIQFMSQANLTQQMHHPKVSTLLTPYSSITSHSHPSSTVSSLTPPLCTPHLNSDYTRKEDTPKPWKRSSAIQAGGIRKAYQSALTSPICQQLPHIANPWDSILHSNQHLRILKTTALPPTLDSSGLPTASTFPCWGAAETMATSRELPSCWTQIQFHTFRWRHWPYNQHHECILVERYLRDIWSRAPGIPCLLWHETIAWSTVHTCGSTPDPSFHL